MRTLKLFINFLLPVVMSCTDKDMKSGPVFITADTTHTVVSLHEINASPNIIYNPEELYPLRNLISTAARSQRIINVLHIGDSHIKSGLYSQPFMQKLNSFYSLRYNNRLFFNFQWFCKTGTKYADYDGLAELESQLKNTTPDLVIISLGTNDAFSGAAGHNFYQQVDRMVLKIKSLAPNASLLITTPPGAMKYNPARGRYEALPALETVVATIIQYCNERKIAYWNLYGVMGGSYTVESWVQQRLSAPDRVHFTAKGYSMFANWLFDAFTKAI